MDEFLTVAEVAEILKLNQQTVRNWIDRGELRAVRVGQRRVRVRRSDLDAFIGESSTRPAETSEWVETAGAVGGALAGTALTLVAGPFVGSASSEAVARVLLRVGAEIERRLLAPRQEQRIARAYQAAADGIKAQLEQGAEVRSDGFFDRPAPDAESPADELLEGVLRTAADEWEQRKVPYIGRIFSTLSFDPSISPGDASFLLKLADRLTYQQVVLLAFWEAAQDASRPYRQEVMSVRLRLSEGLARPAPTILAELNDLASAGLLAMVRRTKDVDCEEPPGARIEGMFGFDSPAGVDLANVRLTDMGETLFRLMALDQVPDDDLMQVAATLHGRGSSRLSSR